MTDDGYNRAFTLHGIIMVWFFLVPLIPATFGNFLLPLMIGAPDVAFPKLNLTSWYLTLIGGILVLWALLAGGVDTGWTFYPPYSTAFSNSNVALAVLGVIVAGFGTIATGVNFVATVHMLRAPGMTWFRMPLFVWTIYATSLVMILATPVLAVTLLLVAADRVFGLPIFDGFRGGDPLLFQHLFWFYSHPAVYIMILPAMGVVTEVITCFARRRVFGYSTLVYAILAIAIIGFCGLGTSHVRLRTVGLRQPCLLLPLLHRRGALGDQGFQLDGDALSRPDHVRSADALRAGLHRTFHDRRVDGPVSRARFPSTFR